MKTFKHLHNFLVLLHSEQISHWSLKNVYSCHQMFYTALKPYLFNVNKTIVQLSLSLSLWSSTNFDFVLVFRHVIRYFYEALKSYLFNVNKTIVQLQKIVTHSTVFRCVLESDHDILQFVYICISICKYICICIRIYLYMYLYISLCI